MTRTITLLLLVIIIFLIKHSNGLIISNNNDTGRPGEGKKDSIQSKDPIGSGILYVGGIVTSFANVVGCCIIIIITFNKWKKRKPEKLSPSQRFPLYMSIMDLLIALTTIPNLFYPMQNDKLLNSGGLCEGIGFSISLFIVMNMSLMAVIAVVTYLRVCMRRVVSLGNYDWILGAIILVPSSLISILTIVTYGYGEDNYWCFMNRIDYQNGSKVSMITLIIFAYIVIIITTFCYLKVIKRIHGVETMLTSPVFKSIRKRRNISTSRDISRRKFSTASSLRSCPSMLSSKSSHTSQNTSDGLELRPPSFFMNTLSQYRNSSTNPNIPTIEQLKIASNITRATRKMASYIFLQLMQYTPFIIYCLCFLFDIIQSWVYILFIVLINLGGVAKSLAFLRNEIFFKKNDSNYSGNSSGTTRHSRNSSNNSITSPSKSYPSKKSHRLNPSLSSTISNYSSHSNNNNNNNNNNIGMMSTIVENDLPSLPSSPTRANTDLTLVDKNDSYITKDRNTSIYKNNDVNNDDNIIEVVDDDLEGSESSEYEWCEDDMIDIDFLVPFIFSDQSIITTPPPALTFSSETRKIFNRNLRESSLLNINTPSNIESSTFNNSYCNSFISYNESIPDPYFHNNGDNSSIS
ncbi:hypothetical protein RhiirA5_503262 [Rhizophagus irregularis]|uniref:G-protein coupled receptors family 1 profile domain-containing protein n=2 Tax=Rhizophagus irregularis TaxID=588596 RepID=A0A2I1E156_9GLOM|nr:hypothetical protein RhiirA5_503262 [Rhizophagus irregularis]PKC61299.1 hypothetical protein RhiirA1_539254 [Rhizophagus irregularis]PKY15860.1 hypothetical protein RhiirB3_466988 [Rhizophagus irregularis]UZO19881.1 hypothetical protein OCT59_011150 [Rhizophagus irregularis]CAB5183002.1 unnamed protein product [Rhizophagus irregularis]